MRNVLTVAATTMLLTGCGADGEIFNPYDINANQSVSIDAQQRVISNISLPPGGQAGQINPNRIICAEPSPDVATTISRSFALGLQAAVQTPEGVSGQGAMQLNSSLAQSMAQLGERTATIQLLRDSLYRACEAYANGALSNTSYALILSRFDVFAATLMLGEVGGGAFGRSLAAIGGVASSGGPSTADEAALTAAKEDLKTKEGETTKAFDDQQDALKATPQDPALVESTTKELKLAQERETAARLNVMLAEIAQAGHTAAGGISTAAGGIAHTASAEIAEKMHAIQKDYLIHASLDPSPVLATCISSLTGPNSETGKAFQEKCIANMDALLAKMLEERGTRANAATEAAKALSTLAVAASNTCGNKTADPDGKQCEGILQQMSALH